MSRKRMRIRLSTRKANIRSRRTTQPDAFEEREGYDFWLRIGRAAATNAINENRALNLPITQERDGWVVRIMPDGELQQISKIQELTKTQKFTKGTVLNVKLR